MADRALRKSVGAPRCVGGRAGAQPRVRLIDGSRIEGPGKTCFRLHLCYDVAGQRIADFAITPLDKGETLDRVGVQPGDIAIADRGYPQPDGMRATRDAGADLLVRLTWNSLNLRDGAGEPVDWLALFAKADAAGHFDMPVTVHKARGRFKPLPMRLVITPKPPDIAERARDVARHNARKDQHDVDPRTLRAAGYMILITSLDATAFPPQLLVRLYRVRWQIELAFKRLKSILRLDRLPAKGSRARPSLDRRPPPSRAPDRGHNGPNGRFFPLLIPKRPRPPPRPPRAKRLPPRSGDALASWRMP